MSKNWWDIDAEPINVTKPVFETSDGWTFTWNPPAVLRIADAVVAGFAWDLTSRQLEIVNELIERNALFPIHYETWEEFCRIYDVTPSEILA